MKPYKYDTILLVPVTDKSGVILLDIYIDGRWIGSRRTYKQCEKVLDKLLSRKEKSNE